MERCTVGARRLGLENYFQYHRTLHRTWRQHTNPSWRLKEAIAQQQQYFISHATSRTDKHSLKHVRESENDKKKTILDLKLLFLDHLYTF